MNPPNPNRASGMPRNQSQDAKDLYDNRAASYDDSWHPRFAKHMIELARLEPGETVLDLACGTGLATLEASKAVGDDGEVVGVDISKGMLAQANAKLSRHHFENIRFFEHSITELDGLAALQGRRFDVITCCSALVLLEHPIDVLKKWLQYLKPGGRLIVDVTHIRNLTAGVVMERVGQALGRPLPYHRLNFAADDSLETALTAAGYVDVGVEFLSQITHNSTESSGDLKHFIQEVGRPKILKEYDINDADGVFDAQIDGVAVKNLAFPPETRAKARELFRERWQEAADADGLVREVDGVFVAIGFRPSTVLPVSASEFGE